MHVCEVVRADPDKVEKQELLLIGDRVSRLWNAANYRCRQDFVNNRTVETSSFKLIAIMQDTSEYRQLPSDIAQEVLKKLSEAWKSYFELRRIWQKNPQTNKPGLPRYRKDRKTSKRPTDFIPIKHPRSYSISDREIAIVLPRDRRTSERLTMPYRGRRRHTGQMGRAELRFDQVRKRHYFSWSVVKEPPKPHPGQMAASVDLGVRILASLSIEGVEQAWNFEGRELLKEFDYLGGQIALEQAHISDTRKVDEKPPFSRAISALYRKRTDRLLHGLRCIAKEIATTCSHHGVGVVYLGWPKHILRDQTYGSLWSGRIHNFWSFDKTLGLLEGALAAVGITTKRVGERGTSSKCPTCHSQKVTRSPRWRLRCRACGEAMHSDQAGSRNILIQQKPSVCWAGAEAAPRTVTARWTRHKWQERSVNPFWLEPEFLRAA